MFKECKWMSGIKLLPTEAFCPVEEEKNWMIFDAARSKLVAKRLEEHDSLGTINQLFSFLDSNQMSNKFMQAFDCGGATRRRSRAGVGRIERLPSTKWPTNGVH